MLVRGRRIAAVGPWRALSRAAGACKSIDLGEVLLMPSLVNAHCHLDYTHMAGHFPPPRCFTDWIQGIVETKSAWSTADYWNSWVAGAKMLVATGTGTVADIEAVPHLLPRVWDATPLRVVSFLEVIGVGRSRPPRELVAELVQKVKRLKSRHCRAGLSPHATYSTVPEVLRLSASLGRRHRWLLTTHVSESAIEFEMFTRARGPMYKWIQRSTRDMSDCDGRSPVEHLDRCGMLGPNLLAVHANYLGRHDVRLLGRARVNVVHCPRSHAYFGHAAFPYERLVKNGLNICLGTDSLASVCKSPGKTTRLNMFDEMRAFAAAYPTVPPRHILRMATVNGARALHLEGRTGELIPGAFADLTALPFADRRSVAYDSILRFTGDVRANMIAGSWALSPRE